MKTSELTGAQLDYWVAKAGGLEPYREEGHQRYWLVGLPGRPCTIIGPGKSDMQNLRYSPSVNWADGGPIIERERIAVTPDQLPSGRWTWHATYRSTMADTSAGDTPLIAAMRAYVASKFGEEVPDGE